MSDVTVAPDASPQPANEVHVDPNPTSLPNPVGPQAPSKPAESEVPTSRREVIQKAFEKTRAAQAKPADAKMGHNQPPEAMEKEQAKPEPKKEPPLNLRKRPVDQEPRERAEHGHFAPREPNAAISGQLQGQQPGTQQQTQPNGIQPRHRQPLPRMSAAAKTEWAKVPEPVQADIHRLHDEFGRAYQRYRGDHEAMNVIRPFHDLARQQGTTLQTALSNYVQMEHKLRADPIGGLDLIVDNLNLRTPEGRKLNVRDLAWHIVNQTPEQQQLLQTRNAAQAQTHQMQRMRQEQQALANELRRMQYAAAFGQTRGAVDQFAEQHPRLDELGDLIEQEVKLGFDLATAYQRAELLRPATAAQTRTNGTAAQTRSTTAQTRPADRSISGAPGGPSNGNGAARSNKPVSRRDALANAIKRVNANGSL